jgi:hypothetical protein
MNLRLFQNAENTAKLYHRKSTGIVAYLLQEGEIKMNKSIVLLLLITALNIIPNGVISDNKNDEDDEGQDDTQEEEDESEPEESISVEPEAEIEAVDEETEPLNGTPDEAWLNTAVRDIAYYLRAHKFNDYDRRLHVNESIAPRVSILASHIFLNPFTDFH